MEKKRKIQIVILVVLIIFGASINEISQSFVIRAILASVAGVSIAICICRLNSYNLDKLNDLCNKTIKLFKYICILFIVALVICNVLTYDNINNQYKNISKNVEFLEEHGEIKLLLDNSDVVTKYIGINTIKLYDGISYIRYSILNENDKYKVIKEKYSKAKINNEIITMVDTIDLTSVKSTKDSVVLALKSKKLIKNTEKLIKLQYLATISISIILYLGIRKCIFFNKKRKNNGLNV